MSRSIRETFPMLATALLLALSTSTLSGGTLAAGSGGGGMGAPMTSTPQSPQAQAERQYEAGLKYKKRAWRYEQQAAAATDPKKAAKLAGKAQTQYVKAVKSLGKAVALDNDHVEALNELGYAYRKSGDYPRAIAAYNAALTLRPDFAEAIEYRGEALLALERFEDVKNHYMWLFQHNTELAAQLMDAIQAWKVSTPADNPERSAFVAWVDERAQLAGQHNSLSLNATRSW